MIGMMQRLGVRVPIMLFGGLAFAFALEPVLTCILVAVLPVMLFIVLFIARKGIRLYARLQGSVDTMVRKVRGDYGGIRVIKALSREDYEREAFRGIAGRSRRAKRAPTSSRVSATPPSASCSTSAWSPSSSSAPSA